MLSVEQAKQLVLQTARQLPAESRPLQDTLGLILAEDVASDLDMPPYDKALMDGFAVRTADVPEGRGELEVIGEILAGETPAEKAAAVAPGQAVRIMTGAPIPPGSDAVVAVERTSQGSADKLQESEVGSQGSVVIDDARLKSGQNIMRRGTEMTRGQLVLKSGTPIRPPEIGLLAAVGRATVSVFPRPTVAIVSTGNEIVEAHEKPGPGQIRNSNGATLSALVTRAGGVPNSLGIARDTGDDLRRLIQKGLEADLLILSGGVSAGDLDLVPGVLRELGVREVFHKVNLKPGKPVWFGVAEVSSEQWAASRAELAVTRPNEDASNMDQRSAIGGQSRPTAHCALPTAHCPLVFGLPGNPVSVMACFVLFVRPAIRSMMGFADPGARLVWASLTEERAYRSDRPTYWPAWLEHGEDGFRIRPVAWHGSPDLRAMTDANAFVIFPPGDHQYRAGDKVQVLCPEY
jgi:molybdopterin molybdotransferase